IVRLSVSILLIGCFAPLKASDKVPFSTDSTSLTVWNGSTYEPFFIKGTNLGVAKPGTYPGEMLALAEDYVRWFTEIKAAGFNCIRLYTLHFPHFYEELRKYNLQNPQQPLFFFQGVWLNEELEGYKLDMYQLTDTFKVEIDENIDCVHGNRTIASRRGKAFGKYTADVSKWNIGYIIGREVYPEEVMVTNENNAAIKSFAGNVFSIDNASATEVWITEKLNHLVEYERTKYNTQRPVSASSWPTLDPIYHAFEPNRLEDTAQVDISKVKRTDAPAGIFASYHAYPYYPDFIGADPGYKAYSDKFGPNSYLGYLIDLKSHYKTMPLLIAEYGLPSSWGVAHYTSSGMNHGGFDDQSQGETNMRLLSNIKSIGLAGGIQFAWIDEWFKSTWITDPVDFGDKILWHNATAAEQNFGLKKFVAVKDWNLLKSFDNKEIKAISVKANYDFLELKIDLKSKMDLLGECWVALDTYDALLGEIKLPNGATMPTGAEFVLHITQHAARLYVTQAYDVFGLWHRELIASQKLQSTATNGAGWNIVRWKNNSGYSDVQFIGELKLNKSFQPSTSKDAVTIFDTKIELRIPWTLLNIVDPSKLWVLHDDKVFPYKEVRVSDGVAFNISYKNEVYTHNTRFKWNGWNAIFKGDVEEQFKTAYWVMLKQLADYNTKATVFPDAYTQTDSVGIVMRINAQNGVLKNDFDMDSKMLDAVLTDAPANGFVELNADGSFIYIPRKGFVGIDRFQYAVFDGQDLSNSTSVQLNVKKQSSTYYTGNPNLFKLFPNPSTGVFNIKSDVEITSIKLLDEAGRLFKEEITNAKSKQIDVSYIKPGIYFIITNIGGQYFSEKFIKK
ncbi:MAG: T9SS type A sorting domain-containing protein, partial [Paludibacter sp.]|nr:T9SS type A sorting domain-containing protein [Paludibacter sp.]